VAFLKQSFGLKVGQVQQSFKFSQFKVATSVVWKSTNKKPDNFKAILLVEPFIFDCKLVINFKFLEIFDILISMVF
jgi:hypothetical protein